MTDITKIVDHENNVTLFTVTGSFLLDQILECLTTFYAERHTLNLVFDLRKADVSSLTSDDMEAIVRHAKSFGHLRESGKTALVMSGSLSYGLARMYEIHAFVNKHKIHHHVWKSMDDAMAWIRGERRGQGAL